MVARNMKQIEDILRKNVRKAMGIVAAKVEADMYEETGGFYTQGKPVKYVRTGTLGDTPKTTAISETGNMVTFNAYLDQSHQYTTGKSPSMGAVLDVANDHGLASAYALRPPLGKQHFWERAEAKMEQTFNDTMNSFFR